ncbi:MAG: GTPase HflX [SAR324 cluster bacterium]|nr:GTPase HflX [SAR324 cluster bacterium]
MISDHQVIELGNALLLKVQLPSHTESEALQALEELASLATTVGCQVKEQIIQARPQIHPATFVGKGKLSIIKEAIHHFDIHLVIVDGLLTPKQGKNLEDSLKCMVWDRTQLILEIFVNNAKTHEAKKQIELARLQYMLPRLVGMWAHLDRERGGIGASRGMGEKQIETDRRVIRSRIAHLKEDIIHVENERNIQKKRRSHCLKVSLIGYTNAGKSTVMNALTESALLVENKLFATLDSTTRMLDEKNRPQILLSDTVGFIKNLPHELVASFRSTLEVVRDADLLFHVIDVSAADYEEHITTTLQVLDELEANRIPRIMVFNKIDQIKSPTQLLIMKKQYPQALFVSAQNDDVAKKLRKKIIQFFDQKMKTVSICLDYQESHNLAHVYEWSRVDQIDYMDDGIHLTLTAPSGNLSRLRHQIGSSHFQGEQAS